MLYQLFSHILGDEAMGVVDTTVFSLFGDEPFIGFPKNILVNFPVVVMDQTLSEYIFPLAESNHPFKSVPEMIQVFVIFLDKIPDLRAEELRIVVIPEPLFQLSEKVIEKFKISLELPFGYFAEIFVVEKFIWD